MIDIQTISIVLAACSFILAVIYYVLNLKHQRESREATLFNSISQSLFNQERWDTVWELFLEWEYLDYDDFMAKYGPEVDLDAYKRFHHYFSNLEGVGIYLKRGLIRPDLIDDFMSSDIILLWEKFKPYIVEARKRRNHPQYYEHFEYLYNEIKPIRDKQHPELKDKTTKIT